MQRHIENTQTDTHIRFSDVNQWSEDEIQHDLWGKTKWVPVFVCRRFWKRGVCVHVFVCWWINMEYSGLIHSWHYGIRFIFGKQWRNDGVSLRTLGHCQCFQFGFVVWHWERIIASCCGNCFSNSQHRQQQQLACSMEHEDQTKHPSAATRILSGVGATTTTTTKSINIQNTVA